MTKVWLCAVLILGSALGAAAQTGAPVVGQEAGVYLNTVSVRWNGVPADEAHALYARASLSPHVTPVGLACHIGSQITTLEPLEAAFRALRAPYLIYG